jgi:hypothetical protein
MGVSQTPGLSGSTVVLPDQGAPVLHIHERVPFFAGLTAAPVKRRPRVLGVGDQKPEAHMRVSGASH